jgi:hypothetical protein
MKKGMVWMAAALLSLSGSAFAHKPLYKVDTEGGPLGQCSEIRVHFDAAKFLATKADDPKKDYWVQSCKEAGEQLKAEVDKWTAKHFHGKEGGPVAELTIHVDVFDQGVNTIGVPFGSHFNKGSFETTVEITAPGVDAHKFYTRAKMAGRATKTFSYLETSTSIVQYLHDHIDK